jgi:hypothetical protein
MFRGLIFAAALLAAPAALAQTYDVEALGVPRFVDVNYLALNKITSISKFRSSTGHDQADSFETCRSMKHYFIAPDPTVPVYAPVTGTVTRTLPDSLGTQVRIKSDAQPAFTFILYHVGLSSPLSEGAVVTAGQQLGTHISNQTYSDIAVRVEVGNGQFRYVSYFETLTDTAFAAFQARGITSRDQLVISRQARDAAPYTCNGETFVNPVSPASTEWAALSAVPRLLVGPIYPGSRTDARSYLRFHNQSAAAGSVSIDFLDAATGARVAQWRSPPIPAGASLQYGFGIIEYEAKPTAVPSYYTLDVASEFAGRFQHVVVDTAAFLLLNRSACSTTVTGYAGQLANVHASVLDYGYPSFVGITNTSRSQQAAILDIHDAQNGDKLGTYVSPLLPPGGYVGVPVHQIERDAGITPVQAAYHYNIRTAVPFSGYLQHLVRNLGTGVETDMTPTCALP